ncbi:MAG: TolB family protein [Gemmatimonadales bacterium]
MSKMLAGLAVGIGLFTPLSEEIERPTGSQEQITFFQHVQWSDDGKFLVASAMQVDRAVWERERFAALARGQFDLQVIPTDGGVPTVVGDSAANEMWATWWPGYQCLLYNLEQRDRSSSLHFIKANGTDRQALKGLTGSVSQPAVTRDGKKLAFVAAEGTERHIYVIASEGGASVPRKITPPGSINHHPAWSPDGSRIVFFSKRPPSDRDHLFVINADGSEGRQLTDGRSNNVFPSGAPDGEAIVFVSDREGSGSEGAFTMSPDGSGVRRLLPGTRIAYARWSPDGRRLAFIGGDFPDTHVFVANADGSNRMQVPK